MTLPAWEPSLRFSLGSHKGAHDSDSLARPALSAPVYQASPPLPYSLSPPAAGGTLSSLLGCSEEPRPIPRSPGCPGSLIPVGGRPLGQGQDARFQREAFQLADAQTFISYFKPTEKIELKCLWRTCPAERRQGTGSLACVHVDANFILFYFFI